MGRAGSLSTHGPGVKRWLSGSIDGQGPTGRCPWSGLGGYFLAEGLVAGVLPNRFSNLATRPPVSRIFCLPV